MIEPNMGEASSRERVVEHLTMANALFTVTQQRVLGALFGQPSRAFYANELIDFTRGGTGAVQRELQRLALSGLVTVRSVGNQRHYQANPDAPIYAELCAIAAKTFALGSRCEKPSRHSSTKLSRPPSTDPLPSAGTRLAATST
jgi:hypothetical protein